MGIPLRLLPSTRHLLIASILLTSAACATSNPFVQEWESLLAEISARAETPTVQTVQIEISNHSLQDLRVHLLVERSGVEFRLGLVGEGETVVFNASEGMLAGAGHYRLITRPFGAGRGFRTERVAIVPGRLHRWTLMPTNAIFHGGKR